MAYKNDKRPMCHKCKRHVGYKVKTSADAFTIGDEVYSYTLLTAICSWCASEVYVPLINDLNCETREAAYRKK